MWQALVPSQSLGFALVIIEQVIWVAWLRSSSVFHLPSLLHVVMLSLVVIGARQYVFGGVVLLKAVGGCRGSGCLCQHVAFSFCPV